MKHEKRNNRKYIIIGLLSILLIMTVGFAAFATNLTINGTANISTSWCIGFYNGSSNTYEITKGVASGTTPTAGITYSGTACSTNYVPTASLSANFYQPGDKVTYTLTIANKGNLDAVIESISVDGTSVTSNQTIVKGNIIWKVNMPTNTTLSATTGTTTMTVSAEFQNEKDIEEFTTSESQSISIGINAIQSTGSNGMTTTTPTNIVYARHTSGKTIGSSTITGGRTNYTLLDTYPEKPNFLKYEINGSNVIQNGWACMKYSFLSEPVCLQGGNASYYESNKAILNSLKSTFTSNGGSCAFDIEHQDGYQYSYCTAGGWYVFAYSHGAAGANGSSWSVNCYVGTTGNSSCVG